LRLSSIGQDYARVNGAAKVTRVIEAGGSGQSQDTTFYNPCNALVSFKAVLLVVCAVALGVVAWRFILPLAIM